MKKINYFYILLPLIIVGCTTGDENQKEEIKDTALTVQTEKVVYYDGSYNLSYSGVVEARHNTPLSFSNSGLVTEIFVEEGQEVQKGDLLAKINSSNYDNMYQLALQKQQQAEDAYKRLKPMKENGTLTEIKWVEVETGLNQAKSATAIAKKNLDDCNLYAPKKGIIGKKNIITGVNVLQGISAFDLLNINTVYIKIPVSESEINLFKKGEIANISIVATSQVLSGTIKEIGVSADLLSHTYPVKIEVQNEGHIIKPGMICSVTIPMKKTTKGVLISNKALQRDVDGKQFVYVVNKSSAKKKEVKTVALIAEKVLIKGDLKEGDEIIISGQDKLHDNSVIKVIR
jgi:RND family efflux transporter MFP subunit